MREGGRTDMSMPREPIICDYCQKMKRGRYNKAECAVLRGDLPVWGENCAAYSDDPDWLEKAKRAGDEYQARKGGR